MIITRNFKKKKKHERETEREYQKEKKKPGKRPRRRGNGTPSIKLTVAAWRLQENLNLSAAV